MRTIDLISPSSLCNSLLHGQIHIIGTNKGNDSAIIKNKIGFHLSATKKINLPQIDKVRNRY